MIRLLALILSLSFFLLSPAEIKSQLNESGSIVDSILVDSTFSPHKPVFHAKNFEETQTKLSTTHFSSGSRKKQRNESRNRTDPQPKDSAAADTFNGDVKFKSFSNGKKSVFDIRVPGDPRVRFETHIEGLNQTTETASSWLGHKKNEKIAVPGDFLKRLGNIPTVTFPIEGIDIQWLEIEVSHSTHIFKLLAHTKDPRPTVLYECKIGLGAPEFPTPVGVYYVTHIYDQDPWWIPPPNRAWAAGDSPSQRVYGGTMAPLLKKRNVASKKKELSSEDRIEGQVKLEDYGYRFHGTNAPRSIGRNQSHGCVRMLSDDARKVASIIKDRTGIADRRESENGSYAILKAPLRLNLVK